MLDPFTPLGQDAIVRAYLTLATLFGRHYTTQTQRELATAGAALAKQLAACSTGAATMTPSNIKV